MAVGQGRLLVSSDFFNERDEQQQYVFVGPAASRVQ